MVQMEGGMVAPEKSRGRLGWIKTLRIWVLVHSEHGDGVAVGVHTSSGWVGSHLASSVHPAGIMNWQHHPLPAVEWVTRVHTRWSRISFLLLCEKKMKRLAAHNEEVFYI